ncbi:hypothetical protein LTS18_009331 [Coniosporium uncinatum]|uniref:Uncharacterized protein n=1 Tax=Coniosporium uncinatum TaxID=93489 RepID=A0ACC3DMP2_9PEZI|nr:hypothetical protein LTS18_009331 [Coniosporium uncinatum]
MLSFISAVLALPLLASAAPALDERAVFPLSTWSKYHCLTLTEFEKRIPQCAVYCEEYTFRSGRDGCAPDDFPCHCKRSQIVSDIIEPCIFPWLNHTATCTTDELRQLQGLVTDSCTFFNATKYADYVACPLDVTLQIAQDKLKGVAA